MRVVKKISFYLLTALLIFNIGLQVVWAKCYLEDAGGGEAECQKGGGGGGSAPVWTQEPTGNWTAYCRSRVSPCNEASLGISGLSVMGTGGSASWKWCDIQWTVQVITETCKRNQYGGLRCNSPGAWRHVPGAPCQPR